MPRAAISVATSTRTAPDLKSFSARSRWFCERFEWIVPVLIPAALEPARDPIGAMLRPGENEDGIELRIGQQMEQKRRLQMRAHFISELRHRVRRIRAPADLDNLGRPLEFVRQLFDFARERGREHERLPFLRQRPHDLPDRRKKTHVQHAIGFVEHEKFELRKIGRALLHQIDQAARRRDDKVDPGTQRLDLRTFAHSAKHRRHAQRKMFRVCAHVLLDLHHQFTRRRHDQRARPAPLTVLHRRCQLCENGKNKRCGFSCAGLRDPDEVVPRQNVRDGSDLNRSRLGVSGFLDRAKNLW